MAGMEHAVEAGRRYFIKRPRLTRLLDEADSRVLMLVAPVKVFAAPERVNVPPLDLFRFPGPSMLPLMLNAPDTAKSALLARLTGAVMLWLPAESVVEEKVQLPEPSAVPAPSLVEPSKKFTVPVVGLPEPVTAAVKVILSP